MLLLKICPTFEQISIPFTQECFMSGEEHRNVNSVQQGYRQLQRRQTSENFRLKKPHLAIGL